MKINDCEILLDGSMTTEELAAYYNRAVDKYGREPIRMTVRVEGDEVALGYDFARVPFERIRRITGYLQTTTHWNNAKLHELADRTVNTTKDGE